MLFIFSPFSSTLRLKSLFALNKNIYALLRNVFINITHELLTTLNSLIDNCYIFIFDTLIKNGSVQIADILLLFEITNKTIVSYILFVFLLVIFVSPKKYMVKVKKNN